MPGTDVRIAENGPRTSFGASGFRSNVSRWLGPPSSQMRMQDFALADFAVRCFPEFVFAADAACMPNRSVIPSPNADNPPHVQEILSQLAVLRNRHEGCYDRNPAEKWPESELGRPRGWD